MDGTDGLVGALWVALSPDGKQWASRADWQLRWSRRPAVARWRFEAVKAADGVSGIAPARRVVSPDAKFVYIGGAS